jgi:hypothetical protein
MREDTKTVLIRKDVHAELKDYSEKTGIKMKVLVETAIKYYLKKIVIKEEE